MNDRIYPSSKTPTNGAAAGNPPFPAAKSQLYGATRPAYRPQPKRHRSRRSCCCSCCLWLTLAILLLLFLIAAACAVVYLIYRPHLPSFSVSSLKVQTLNVTKSQTLVTNITLSVIAKNPNKEAKFYYDPINIFVYSDDDVDVGDGAFPAFVHGTKNTTLLKASIIKSNINGEALDDLSASKLKSELKSNSGLRLMIKLETKVKAKMGAIKSPKVRIRVTCVGIRATVPTGKTASLASTSNAKCKVDMRVKIWKWTF